MGTANVPDALTKSCRISYELQQRDFSICLFFIYDNLGFPFANRLPLHSKLFFLILLFRESDEKSYMIQT